MEVERAALRSSHWTEQSLLTTLSLTELQPAVENGPYKETWPPREHWVCERTETQESTSSSAETNIPPGRKYFLSYFHISLMKKFIAQN